MSFGGAPSAPDPNQLASQQLAFNQQAAKQQQQINEINQTTPFGALNWASDPNAPGGYSANVALTPAQQNLLNLQQGLQSGFGQTATNLLGNVGGMYSQAPDLNSQTGQQLLGLQQKYWNPIFQQQQSNLNAQLTNQGLSVNDQAYQNAQNLLARNQGDVTNQFLYTMQPQVFQQAVQQYQLPLQTLGALSGSVSPQLPGFQSTPNEQIQPPNYSGLAEQQYQQQQAQYAANQQGMFGLASSGIGAAANVLPFLL